jgi:hypothetical protein
MSQRRTQFLILIAAMVVTKVGAFADSPRTSEVLTNISAERLLSECQQAIIESPQRERAAGAAVFCKTYIGGFADGYVIGQNRSNVEANFCIPAGLSVDKVAALFIKKTRTLPAGGRSLAAPLVLSAALHEAFPCSQ